MCAAVLQYGVRLQCSVLQCLAVSCSVLQCLSVSFSLLQCVAVRCGVLRCVAVCCSELQCVAVCCRVLQCVALWSVSKWHHYRPTGKHICVLQCCIVLQYVALLHCIDACCSVLQCVAVCCSVLHCVAVYCSVCTSRQHHYRRTSKHVCVNVYIRIFWRGIFGEGFFANMQGAFADVWVFFAEM